MYTMYLSLRGDGRTDGELNTMYPRFSLKGGDKWPYQTNMSSPLERYMVREAFIIISNKVKKNERPK